MPVAHTIGSTIARRQFRLRDRAWPTPPGDPALLPSIVHSVRLRIAQRARSQSSKSTKSGMHADARLLRPVRYPFPSLSRRPHHSSVHYRVQALHFTLLHPGIATLPDGRTWSTAFRSHNINIHRHTTRPALPRQPWCSVVVASVSTGPSALWRPIYDPVVQCGCPPPPRAADAPTNLTE
jgi:hypothetical protein